MNEDANEQFRPKSQTGIETLDHVGRRVLGTLIEKGFTTPSNYPLTLNSLVTGCNQKSNREPESDYDDGDVLAGLEDLEELELAAVVHTSGSFTDRFRHFARKRLSFLSEKQLAILTELWLRGRQSLGELRARASRMEKIESLDALRTELQPLVDGGYVVASGELGRRGIEVDHNFYLPGERAPITTAAPVPTAAASAPVPTATPLPTSVAREVTAASSETLAELKDELATLREHVLDLQAELADLKRDLGT